MVPGSRGIPPAMFGRSAKPLSGRYLSFAEREEIACCARRASQCRKLLVDLDGQRRRSHGNAAQCCDSKWRLGVSRDNSTMARRAIRSPTKTGEACGQRGVADLCRGAAGWHRRGSGRGTCRRPDGVLERPAPWAAERSAVGKSLEPGADRPPTSNRLPGR